MKFLRTLITKILQVILILILIILAYYWYLYPNLKKNTLKIVSAVINYQIAIETIDLNYDNGYLFANFSNIVLTDKGNIVANSNNSKFKINIFDIFSEKLDVEVFLDDVSVNIDEINSIEANLKYNGIFNNIKNISINTANFKSYNNDSIILKDINIHYDDDKLYFYLIKQDLTIDSIFSQKLPQVKINANIDLKLLDNNNVVVDANIINKDITTKLSLRSITKDNKNYFHISQQIDRLDLTTLKHYLPDRILNTTIVAWVNNAFVSGISLNTDINLLIPLNDDNSNPVLSVFSKLNNVNLNFNDNWPNLVAINGAFEANFNDIIISISDADMANISTYNSLIKINIAEKLVLDAQIFSNNSSADIIDFLAIKPIQEIIPNIDYLNISGKAQSQVSLTIALDSADTTVIVSTKLNNNLLYLPQTGLTMTNVDANMSFTDNIISVEATGSLGGNIIRFDIENDDKGIHINSYINELVVNIFTAYIQKGDNREYSANIISPAIKSNTTITTFADNSDPYIIVNDILINKGAIGIDSFDIKPSNVPNMRIKFNNIKIGDYFSPNFSLSTKKQDDIVLLENGIFDDNDLKGNFNGVWSAEYTKLYMQAQHDKLSELLTVIGIKEAATGGEFTVITEVSCFCNPWDIKLNNIIANASLTVKEGVFNEKDAGIGRVLSLLSIESLIKRLTLNLSDVVEDGFKYDTIAVNTNIDNNYVTINNFNIFSSSGDIDVSGGVDLLQNTLDLQAKVVPAVADSLPILSYLSSGSVVALGIWLADKLFFGGEMLKAAIDNTVSFEYTITGDWASPTIK